VKPEQELLDATGAVLAGGASRRMGRDKAALILDGESLLARVVRQLSAVTRHVLVVGPRERELLVPGVRIVPDVRPGLGPLGGIYSALLAAETDLVFVAGCDMPFVRPPFVRFLLGLAEAHDVVVPRSARGTEQLHAVYSRGCLPAIAARLEGGDPSVASLYQHVTARVVEPDEWAPYDPDGISTCNVNTPAEWDEARARCSMPG
jgi:molybdopterin-guanine dinucleotide biosynthesis protein A